MDTRHSNNDAYIASTLTSTIGSLFFSATEYANDLYQYSSYFDHYRGITNTTMLGYLTHPDWVAKIIAEDSLEHNLPHYLLVGIALGLAGGMLLTQAPNLLRRFGFFQSAASSNHMSEQDNTLTPDNPRIN